MNIYKILEVIAFVLIVLIVALLLPPIVMR